MTPSEYAQKRNTGVSDGRGLCMDDYLLVGCSLLWCGGQGVWQTSVCGLIARVTEMCVLVDAMCQVWVFITVILCSRFESCK